MYEEEVEFNGHKFIKHFVMVNKLKSYRVWKCSICNYESKFLKYVIDYEPKMITCDENITKKLLE